MSEEPKPFDRDLDADEALCNAQPPAPWSWEVNPKSKSVRLKSWPRGGYTVMGFERWGRRGAQPTFLCGPLLEDAKDLAKAIPGREHHADWALQLDHPIANFIAEVRSALPAYIAEVRRLRAILTEGPRLSRLQLRPDGGLELETDHWAARHMAENFRDTLGDAPNYIACLFELPEGGRLQVTIRRVGEKTAAERNLELMAENGRLRDFLQRIARQLEPAIQGADPAQVGAARAMELATAALATHQGNPS